MGPAGSDGRRAAEMDPSQTAKADFEPGVVRITATEYETALAVAAGRTASTA